MTGTILVVHAASTWWMVGLIWFVQVVHYPLFANVGPEGWTIYANLHRARTTLVVMPPMLVELATSIWLVSQAPGFLTIAGVVLVGALWGSTFLIQVPLHARLGTRWNDRDASLLVRTNWIRTMMWSARGAIALMLLTSMSV